MSTTKYVTSKKKAKPTMMNLSEKKAEKAKPDLPAENGKYERNRNFLYALEYYFGIDTPRSQVMRRLVLSSIMKNDEATLNQLLPVPLDQMREYERDKAWEKLDCYKKREMIEKGEVPTYERYSMEIEELKRWDGTEQQIYREDMVGVYSCYTKRVEDDIGEYAHKLEEVTKDAEKADKRDLEGLVSSLSERFNELRRFTTSMVRSSVGWKVTSKIQWIGHATKMAWDNFSSRILLHQILYGGLVFSRTAVSQYISKRMEYPILQVILFHTSDGIKPHEWLKFMVVAAQNGMTEMVSYMNECGTLPDKLGRQEMFSSLVLCSKNPALLTEGEVVSGTDGARDVRIRIVNRVDKLDKEEAQLLREIRIPVGEERERFDASKREKENRMRRQEEDAKYARGEALVEESELIDVDELMADVEATTDNVEVVTTDEVASSSS
jgi:hypothetical protein